MLLLLLLLLYSYLILCIVRSLRVTVTLNKVSLILFYVIFLVSEMTYYVSSGTLNSTNSTYVIFVYFNIKYIGRQVLF